MMKTNWNSTWPVIYQSTAAKLVPFACEGIQPVSLKTFLHAPPRPGEGEIRKGQGKISRNRMDFGQFWANCYFVFQKLTQTGKGDSTDPTPRSVLRRFLTTIHVDKLLREASGSFECVEHSLTEAGLITFPPVHTPPPTVPPTEYLMER